MNRCSVPHLVHTPRPAVPAALLVALMVLGLHAGGCDTTLNVPVGVSDGTDSGDAMPTDGDVGPGSGVTDGQGTSGTDDVTDGEPSDDVDGDTTGPVGDTDSDTDGDSDSDLGVPSDDGDTQDSDVSDDGSTEPLPGCDELECQDDNRVCDEGPPADCAECLPGYENCDDDLEGTGCEVRLSSDANNCGACGEVCAEGFNCADGMCLCPGGTVELEGRCVDETELQDLPLGASCSADAQCVNRAWCPVDTTHRRCSPRLYPSLDTPMDFVFIPAGGFIQGLPGGGHPDARPFESWITYDFFMGRTAVTRDHWEVVYPDFEWPDTFPLCFGRGDCPATGIRWVEALQFANDMSDREGLDQCYKLEGCTGEMGIDLACSDIGVDLVCNGYRLATEAEYEYAARGGLWGYERFPWGSSTSGNIAGQYAWYEATSDTTGSGRTLQPVGRLLPNVFGLLDMVGNNFAWVSDSWQSGHYPVVGTDDWVGRPGETIYRSMRGCSFASNIASCEISRRSYGGDNTRAGSIGLRLVRRHVPPGAPHFQACTEDADCSSGYCAPDGTCRVPMGGRCRNSSDCGLGAICTGTEARTRCTPVALADTTHRLRFIQIPAGTFTQGTPGTTEGERAWESTLTRPFLLAQTPVTQAQWAAVMGSDNQPSYNTGCSTCPVERVNWFEAIVFTNALSEREDLTPCYEVDGCEGVFGGGCDGATCFGDYQCNSVRWVDGCDGYRLPTESEWERAARSGTVAFRLFVWGNDSSTDVADRHAWYFANSVVNGERSTHSVAGLEPSPWGLHDMAGNVQEWVWDIRGTYPTPAAQDWRGPSSGTHRVYRGGSFNVSMDGLRIANRIGNSPRTRGGIGLRVARDLP